LAVEINIRVDVHDVLLWLVDDREVRIGLGFSA